MPSGHGVVATLHAGTVAPSVVEEGTPGVMSEMPLVSAIIPVYNGERFIREAIDSVLGQTYPAVECLVIDDGSVDGTPEILATYGTSITVVRQPNGGVSAARNAGVAASSGELIALLDADDRWRPDKIARQVAALSHDPAIGLVYSGFDVVDADLRRRYTILPSRWEDRIRGVVLHEGYGIGLSFTGLLRRQVFDVVGPFDLGLSTSADADYAWRVSRQYRVVGVDGALAQYRQHGRSQMHDDLAALEHDMSLMVSRAAPELGESLHRRGLANLHTHLAAGHLRRGNVLPFGRHLAAALRLGPQRVVLLPPTVLWRRLTRLALRRWPSRSVDDPSVVG